VNSILQIKDVSKSFGGVKALLNAGFAVEKGTIHSVIGPNGSGKTTLINVITGFYQPDSGEVLLNGTVISNLKPYSIARLGIARTFQNLRLFNSMTVADNVKTALHYRLQQNLMHTLAGTSALKKSEEQANEQVANILEKLELTGITNHMVSGLPYGQRRLVEIARALSLSPQILLLDEPVAGMNPSESLDLIKKIRKLVDDGTTVILVEHDMKVVMKYSDAISVLNYGQIIAHGSAKEIQNNQCVIEAYLGMRKEYEC
jgi:ABC-type branched-subunit amino acid transport system ATPase component